MFVVTSLLFMMTLCSIISFSVRTDDEFVFLTVDIENLFLTLIFSGYFRSANVPHYNINCLLATICFIQLALTCEQRVRSI